MARSSSRSVFALSDFDVITGPPSLPSRLPSPAGGSLPSEAIPGKPAVEAKTTAFLETTPARPSPR